MASPITFPFVHSIEILPRQPYTSRREVPRSVASARYWTLSGQNSRENHCSHQRNQWTSGHVGTSCSDVSSIRTCTVQQHKHSMELLASKTWNHIRLCEPASRGNIYGFRWNLLHQLKKQPEPSTTYPDCDLSTCSQCFRWHSRSGYFSCGRGAWLI